VFQRSLTIDGRGISVPLPPPSLYDAPKQSVDVVVMLDGEGDLSPGSELHIVDNEGELSHMVELDDASSGQSQTIEGLAVDLTLNCLELWLVDGDYESEHALYRAQIADDGQSIETVAGCE